MTAHFPRACPYAVERGHVGHDQLLAVLDAGFQLKDPNQWGFGIFGGTSAPSGHLGFDNFRSIPEPATMALIGLGAVALLRRRR